ncbi:MAG: amidase family protein [Caulobacter sp.]|nr:amidase family protein [Caulobacter sp.]
MTDTLTTDLARATAGETVRAIADREISALEATDAAIARIEARDGAINAVVVRDFDRAREAARAADAAIARGERGPLLGVPMTVKEANWVAGLRTTWGMEHWSDWKAPVDGVGIARLKAAGAIILGKTNVPPMLADFQSDNPVYGRTNNPWDLTRTPGGSSGGGGAALAAGMVPLEFGSDIGGSIRIPAGFCGAYGHKPSYGVVPLRGHTPPGLDGVDVPVAVVGPMARTAADLDLALGVLAGPDDSEAVGYSLAFPPPRHGRLADYRVLILDHHPLAAADDEIREALDALGDRLEDLGARIDRHTDLLPDLADAHEVYGAILNTALTMGQPGARPPNAHEWMTLLTRQLFIRRQWARLFKGFDVVLAPSLGTLAFPHDPSPDMGARTLLLNGEKTPYFNQIAWSGVATLGHLPATAAPVGLSKAGLPIGIQIIGPYLEDRTTIAFAGLLEREFGGFVAPPGY